MHRYEELEKKYYKKRYLKIFFSFISLVILSVAGYFLYKSEVISKEKAPIKQQKKEAKKVEEKVVETNKTKEINKTKQIKPKKAKKETKKTDKLIFVVPEINENEIKEEKPKEIKKDIKKEIKKPVSKPVTKPKPKIEIKEKPISINELKQKFSQKPSYDLAMMIAKTYFNQKNYKQAQIWAIKANNLDPQKVESWVLFADILLKENKKQKAREILKIYLDQYGEDETIRAKLRSINE